MGEILERKTKYIVIVIVILFLAVAIHQDSFQNEKYPYKLIGNNSLGTVDRMVCGNANANNTIALITGIHPREVLAVEPEITAAKEYVKDHQDVKIIVYQVNVTKSPQVYQTGRDNGESLVHDFVNPDVTKSDAQCVIISHSHKEGYGEGYYLATPDMDNASVEIAQKINNTTDFGYYPKTGNEEYQSTSAQLVSNPIAEAGYPTFVYEIPENITQEDSTKYAKDLFDLMVKYAC